MRTIPRVLGDVVLSMYEADALGNPNVGRPVFMGARTERLRETQRIEEFEFTGSGEAQRDYGQLAQDIEIAVDGIQCQDGRSLSGFQIKRGIRYVLAIYGQDERTRVYARRTYYGVQTKERSESGDQGQQYFMQSKVFRALFCMEDGGRLAEGQDSLAGVPALPNPVGLEQSYLFFFGGPAPAGEMFVGQFRFGTAMRLTYAKAIAQAGSSGADTVLQLEGNGTPLTTLTLAAGSGEVSAESAADLSIDIPANTLLRWRVLSAPADVENMAAMISVTMNLTALDGTGAVISGTPPGGGSGGGGVVTPPAVAGAITERKDFVVPSAVWTWVHGLGYRPIVEVFDADGNELVAAVEHVDANTIQVSHLSNLTGFVIIVH